MGTDSIEKLQLEIKNHLLQLGWSQRKLAEEVYYVEFGDGDVKQINNMRERIKKDLSRPIKKLAPLQQYLKVIQEHEDFYRLQLIVPRYYPSKYLNPQLERKMRKLSGQLTAELEMDNLEL